MNAAQVCGDLAVRAARAEIERDEAIKRAESAEAACRAVYTQDVDAMLDTLHVIGIPARDLKDIFAVVSEWRRAGGRESLLDLHREFAEAERVLRVISGWNPDRVDTADAIQPAVAYFAAKESHAE